MIARVMLVILLLAIGTAHAQVYRWKDKHGKVHYGDDPSTAGATALTSVSGAPGTKRTAAPGKPATQPQKTAQGKTAPQQETEPQPRQAERR